MAGLRAKHGFFQSMSGTLVSVELLSDMRAVRAHRSSSRRVILRASITSVILLSIAFIITYSVILTYVSSKMPLMRHQDNVDKSKSGKRAKLVAKPMDFINKENILKFVKSNVVKWDVKDYYEEISKPTCRKNQIVILITSATANYKRRESIRNTWCNPHSLNLTNTPWLCVFLVGKSQNSSTNVAEESLKYDDILLGSYIDSYRNLTIKIMHGLDWVKSSCPTQYVLKTDDDVYVNTLLLHQLVNNHTQSTGVYIGLVMQTDSRLSVIRNQDSRWYVSLEEYPSPHYPPYASGMGYLLSADVVNQIVEVSHYLAPFANEDAYIGVLINNIGVVPVRSGRFTLTSSGLRTCNFQYLVVVHHVAAEEQYRLLEINREARQTCHDKTDSADNMWS